MIWLGIGVSIIGLALLILAIISIKPLFKLSHLLTELKPTVEQLPNSLNEITTQSKEAIETGTTTLQEVQTQLKEIQPLIVMVGDIGRTVSGISSSLSNKVESFSNDGGKNKKGIYALLAFIIFILKRRKQEIPPRKEDVPQ